MVERSWPIHRLPRDGSDIEHEKLAYYGYSWGAVLGAILPAVEPRLKVAVYSLARG